MITFTAAQFVAHLVGDYIIQSDRMALEKTKSSLWAAIHAATYTLPFWFFTCAKSWQALLFIAATHFIIDRWRLARYVVWAKNAIGGSYTPWADCKETGYKYSRHLAAPWLTTWLLFIADNTLHLICNGIGVTIWG